MTWSLDDRAKRLVAAVAEATGLSPGLPTPSPRILADLYLRIRERLEELGARASLDQTAEDLALTVYLAWLAEGSAPGPGELVSLKACLEKALRASAKGV